ncbi:MAG: Amine oxidase, flavin-containing, partial [uncultured Gemmatimonadaceae bacterium]
ARATATEDRDHRRRPHGARRRLPPQGARPHQLQDVRGPPQGGRARVERDEPERLHLRHRRPRPLLALRVLRPAVRQADGRRVPGAAARELGVDRRPLHAVPVPEQHQVPVAGDRDGVPAGAHRGAEAAARHRALRQLRGAHLRRVRRGDREALHDALQLQGVGAPAGDDEQGVDRRAGERRRHQAGAEQRGARQGRRRVGPELDLQVPALRRHRGALRADAALRGRPAHAQRAHRPGRPRAQGGRAAGRHARAVRRAAEHRADGQVRRDAGRRGAGRGAERGEAAPALGVVHRGRRRRPAVPVEEVLDVLPRGQRAVLPRDVPVELLPRGRARPHAPVLAPRRDLALRVQAGEPRHDRRGDAAGDGQHEAAQGGGPQGRRRRVPHRARLHVPDAEPRARPRAGDHPPVAARPGHLLAGAVRRLALRGGEHGPLGGPGRGVGEPRGVRRRGERADVHGEAGLL